MELTKKESEIMHKPFPITSVCREDLIREIELKECPNYEAIEIALKITDDEMVELADKMADAYLDSDFWTELKVLVPEILDK